MVGWAVAMIKLISFPTQNMWKLKVDSAFQLYFPSQSSCRNGNNFTKIMFFTIFYQTGQSKITEMFFELCIILYLFMIVFIFDITDIIVIQLNEVTYPCFRFKWYLIIVIMKLIHGEVEVTLMVVESLFLEQVGWT